MSHPFAGSRKTRSSWRALLGLAGEPASIVHPSGPSTGGDPAATGALGEGDGAGALPPPPQAGERVRTVTIAVRRPGIHRMRGKIRLPPVAAMSRGGARAEETAIS